MDIRSHWESYATGQSTTTVSTEPVDIVLVLDVSGSMDDPMTQYSAVYKLDTGESYYVKVNGKYQRVRWSGWYESWGYGWELDWHSYAPKTAPDDANQNHVQFYQLITSSQKKIDSLKSAVYSFIDSVNEKSPDSKIAIVKFAGNKTNKIGNDTYRDGRYTYNYFQIVERTYACKSRRGA